MSERAPKNVPESRIAHRLGANFPLLIASGMLFIGMFGLLNIISGTNTSSPLAWRQLIHIAVGAGVLAGAGMVPFRFYREQIPALSILALALLFGLPLCGNRVNGMCGWYDLGFCSVQPSELVKAIYLLSLACALVGKLRFRWVLGIAALWILPILAQPDFGTAAIYLGSFVILIYLVGGQWKKLCPVLLAVAGIAGAFIWTHPYAQKRITAFLAPELDPLGSGWHLRQLKFAVARGHLFGTKLGNAVWSNVYLPLPYNDSALATFAETLGFCGVLLLLLSFLILLAMLARAAFLKGLSAEGRIFLMGCTGMLALQIFVHCGVNLGLLPATGLPLPLISYGGSSFVGTAFLLGIAISAVNSRKVPAPPSLPPADSPEI